ncbi:MAG: hypothetical protein ISS41_11340 [Candidatus Aminicenantes bacterium]|nr:hypothetical protein [Candidatus Aminicenantes bacterium]
MRRIDKVKTWVFWTICLLLILGTFLSVINYNWINVALFLLTLFLTFLPSIIERKLKIDYPSEGELTLILFIFASMYLGEIHAFYVKFWWWDLMLHAISGFIVAGIGFMIIYILNKKKKLGLNPVFVSLFSFSFAVSIGVVWEIFEFSMDFIFGVNMQKSGLADTMWDLIVNSISALIVSYLGYLYLKGRMKSKIIDVFKTRFLEKNSDLFK